MCDAILSGYSGETWFRSPQLQSPDNRGREQVHVNPADAAAIQVPIANEGNNLAVSNYTRLMHLLISGQELPAPSTIADEKLSIDQFMPGHLIKTQEPVQLEGVRRPVGKEPDPHRCIDQNHQRTLRLGDGPSRRLGTSRA
jgi:hypothetical protein